MMSYINETDFVVENKKLVYPEIVTDGLQLYYDAKGKRDTDYHRDTMLDMSGNKNHGKLHNFAYEKHSGYKDGLVFDYIDDKLVRPTLNLKPDDFTFMLNGNIISFSPDGTVKRVQDGEVIEAKGTNLVVNGDFSNGTTDFTISPGATVTEDTTYSATKVKVVSASTYVGIVQTKPFTDGNLIYTSFVGCGDVSAQITTGNAEIGKFAMTETPKRYSIVKAWPTASWDKIGLYNVGIGTNYYGYFVVIDLTETFGAGKEPTKEQMDEIVNRFGFISNAQDLIDSTEYKGNVLGDMENIIDGLYKTEVLSGTEIFTDKADTDAVVHVEVDGKSIGGGSGKNLVELSLLEPSSTLRVKYPLGKLKPGIAYYVSLKNKDYTFWNGGGWVSEGPINDNIRSTGVVIRKGTGKSGAGEEHTVGELIKEGLLQIEEGSTATTYEPPAPTPDYPIEINSLNDFDVVSSVGRENLLSDGVLTHFIRPYIKDGDIYRIDTFTDAKVSNYPAGIKINASIFTIGKTYTLSFKTRKIKGNVNDIAGHSNGFVSQQVFIDGKYISNSWSSKGDYPNDELVHELVVTLDFTGGSGDNNLYIQPNRTSGYSSAYILDIWDLKVEEGLGTPYSSPLSESIQGSNTVDKINLLLDEPLRSVGEVKDRLFRDGDGLWKVERNVKQRIFVGTESFIWATAPYIPTPLSKTKRTKVECSHLVYSSTTTTTEGKVSWGGSPNSNKNMFFGADTWSDLNAFKTWVAEQNQSGTPLTVQYELDAPIIETLPQELQDKLNNLRSFEDSNYVYTVIPNEDNYISDNLKPTLHAKFLYNNWYKEDRVINNLMIYNRALTNEEMLQNYKTIKRRWGM